MVYSTLDTFTTVVSTRQLVTHCVKLVPRVKLVVGATHAPADIIAAAITLSEYSTQEEGICKKN